MPGQSENPFESPQAAPGSQPPPPPEYRQTVKRPVSPLVFGVLAIVFSVLGLLISLLGLLITNSGPEQEILYRQMGYSPAYMQFSQIVGAVFVVLLLYIGIALLRYRNHGRILFNVYASITIIWTVLDTIYMLSRADFEALDFAATAGILGGAIGGLLGLIFPVLGLFFLNSERVKEHLT